jgi:hypothetical protein
MGQAHKRSNRNIPFDMICTLSTTLHRSTQKHLRWHLITKILRNGPRAHFPFNCGSERPPSAAPVVAAATGGRNERNKRPRPQRGNSGSCPVHPNSRHSVVRSSNSQSASANGASRLPRMAPLLVVGLARKGSTAARWPQENRTSGISHPRGS